jgi:hypothetical protein
MLATTGLQRANTRRRAIVTGSLAVMAAALIGANGCGHAPPQSHHDRVRSVAAGMSPDEVAAAAGSPQQVGSVADGAESVTVWHYCDRAWWQGAAKDPANDRDRCTSLYFSEDRLVAVGTRAFVVHQRVEAAKAEVRRQFARKRQSREALRQQQAALREEERRRREAVLERRQEAAWKRRHEATLYQQVLKVPESDHQKNYELYAQLSRLNPEKDLYRRKRDHYHRRMTQAAAAQRSVQRFTAANSHLNVTVQRLGDRGLFVWIRNTGGDAVRVDPGSFNLLAADGRPIRPSRIDPDLIGSIVPDGERQGRIWVAQAKIVRQLVFRPQGQVDALTLPLH